MWITQPRRTVPAAAIASVTLLAAGCGSSPGPISASARSAAPPDLAVKAFQYSECMRSHGASSFPDPTVGTERGGGQSLRLVISRALANSPEFQTARKACRGIMPAPSPSEVAQQQRHEEQGKLAFAECMRSHGVRSFPDPTAQGELTLARVDAAGIDIHAPAVLAAAKACVPASNGTITPADIQRAEASG